MMKNIATPMPKSKTKIVKTPQIISQIAFRVKGTFFLVKRTGSLSSPDMGIGIAISVLDANLSFGIF